MSEIERISQLLRDPDTLERLRREVALRARREHRAAGVPLASTREGRLVLLDPDTLDELSAEEAEKWLRGPEAGQSGTTTA